MTETVYHSEIPGTQTKKVIRKTTRRTTTRSESPSQVRTTYKTYTQPATSRIVKEVYASTPLTHQEFDFDKNGSSESIDEEIRKMEREMGEDRGMSSSQQPLSRKKIIKKTRTVTTSGAGAIPKSSISENVFDDSAYSTELDASYEDGKRIFTFDLPGYKPENIHVKVSNDSVKVTAELEEEEGNKKISKKFNKEISLPKGAEVDKISSAFKNGQLKVFVPISTDDASIFKEISVEK